MFDAVGCVSRQAGTKRSFALLYAACDSQACQQCAETFAFVKKSW